VVLLNPNLRAVLMAVYDRRVVSQEILYIRAPARCLRYSLTICRARITAVNDFAYINVLKVYFAPLCVVMLLNRFTFSLLSSEENLS
jgi:hypothetical protein